MSLTRVCIEADGMNVVNVANEGIEVFSLKVLNPKHEGYKPGDIIYGEVIVVVSKKIRWREFNVTLSGEASTAWTVYRGGRREMSCYQGNQQLLSNKVVLSRETILRPGEYNAKFRFCLPMDCVPSFNSQYGHIFYTLRARIERYIDVEDSVHIIVNGGVNLRHMAPSVKQPVNDYKTKQFGNWFCKKERFSVGVSLPKGGYAITENMAVAVDVENHTTRPVVLITATVFEHALYIGHRAYVRMPYRVERQEMTALFKTETEVSIAPGTKHSLGIPVDLTNVPTPQVRCAVIQTRHVIEICVQLSNGKNVCCGLPITIGTIPLGKERSSTSSSSLKSIQ